MERCYAFGQAVAIGAAATNPRWALDEQDGLTAEEGTPLEEGRAVARRVERLSHRSVHQILHISR